MRGRVLSGRYELGTKLGAGGMGEVWRARDRSLGREVAVKLFSPPADVQPEERTELLGRFRREARAAAALDSPHIATIHDHGTDEDVPYLVMELVEGRSLERVLRDEGRVPVRRALEWAAQICRGLGTAHAAGVVHRDIKPANVIVRPDDTAVVLDFGIAKFQEAVEAESKLTRTGHMPLGSVLYMAPERFRMEEGDGREDLYALGCVLYELLIGRPPYVGPAAGVMYNHLNDVPLRPSRARAELSVYVDQLVLDLMAKSPADRPADAETAETRLRELRAATPDREPEPAPEPVPEPEPEPAPEPEPGPEPADAPEPAPEPAAEPQLRVSRPDPKPQPQAQAQARPKPAPSPAPPFAPTPTKQPASAGQPAPAKHSVLSPPRPPLVPAPRKPLRSRVFVPAVLAGTALLVGGGLYSTSKSDRNGPSAQEPSTSIAARYSIVHLSSDESDGRRVAEAIEKAVRRTTPTHELAASLKIVSVDSESTDIDLLFEQYESVIAVIGDTDVLSTRHVQQAIPPVMIDTCGTPGDTHPPGTFDLQPSPRDLATRLTGYLKDGYGVRNLLVGDEGVDRELPARTRAAFRKAGGEAHELRTDLGAGSDPDDRSGSALKRRVDSTGAEAVLLPRFAEAGEFRASELLASDFSGPVLGPLPADVSCGSAPSTTPERPARSSVDKGAFRYRGVAPHSSPTGKAELPAVLGAAEAYDAVLAVVEALGEMEGEQTVTSLRSSLASTLRAVEVEGTFGTFSFDEEGHAQRRPLWIDRFDGKRWDTSAKLTD